MKRRKFLQNLGLGAAPVLIGAPALNKQSDNFPEYHYPKPQKLQDAVSKEGLIMLRIAFTSDIRVPSVLKTGFKVSNGNVARSRSWFFEKEEDRFNPETLQAEVYLSSADTDVLVLWLDNFSEETQVALNLGNEKFSFTLEDLLKNEEAVWETGKINITANFLLDHEIGELDPAEAGIKAEGEHFTFAIMADPQGGDTSNPDDNRCRMKIHNAFVEESIRLANNLKTKPAFCLMLGDIVDHQGEARDFAQMASFFERLKMPVLYEMGNHESRYNTRFNPGYNLSGFNNYFAAQKALNGMELLLYSFNLGNWHFVVWPDPLRSTFWENHPHYFDWLERDLEKHKNRPTLFFQHIPMHPIGINPLLNYVESVDVKRQLFEILSKHGNVKAIFSGHVHIPVKSSFKTAVEHKGINCINLPAAGYRPRAFGEQDYYGGPSQGIAIVEINGNDYKATYKTVTLEEYQYPDKLPVFEPEKYPLWLGHKWELPAGNQFVNGDFSQGMKSWGRHYVYQEDHDPTNVAEAVRLTDGHSALYLKMRRRGYMTPGQDRLPQDINRIFQAVQIEKNIDPVLEFSYRTDAENCDFDGLCGAYIWIEGYLGSALVINLLYFSGRAWVNMGGTYGRNKGPEPLIFSLDKTPGKWHRVQINVKEDFETNIHGMQYEDARPDRLVISAGTWNVNDGNEQPFAIWLTGFKLSGSRAKTNNDGKPIPLAVDSETWWRGKHQPNTNIAGEHQYHTEGWKNLVY